MAPNSYESLKRDVGCLLFILFWFVVLVVLPALGAILTLVGVLVGVPLVIAIVVGACLMPAFVFVLFRAPFAFRVYSGRLDKLEQKLAAVRERIALHKERTECLSEADRDHARKSSERLLAKQEELLYERANVALALCKHIGKKRERLVARKIRYLETADKRSSERTERFLEQINQRIKKHEDQEALFMERGGKQLVMYDCQKQLPYSYESLHQAYIVLACRKILAFTPWLLGALAILGGIVAAVAAFA